MHHWWKWVLLLTVVCGVSLLMNSGKHAGNGMGMDRAMAATTKPVVKVATRAVTHRPNYWAQWSNPKTTIVPIVSAGTPGIRLGLAQVSGPQQRVNLVRAVLQIDGDFKGIRAKILIPSDSYTSLRRVDGTAVTAVVQYKFISFGHSAKPAPKPAPPAPQVVYVYCEHCKHKHVKDHHDNGLHKGWYKHGNKHGRGHDKGDD